MLLTMECIALFLMIVVFLGSLSKDMIKKFNKNRSPGISIHPLTSGFIILTLIFAIIT